MLQNRAELKIQNNFRGADTGTFLTEKPLAGTFVDTDSMTRSRITINRAIVFLAKKVFIFRFTSFTRLHERRGGKSVISVRLFLSCSLWALTKNVDSRAMFCGGAT